MKTRTAIVLGIATLALSATGYAAPEAQENPSAIHPADGDDFFTDFPPDGEFCPLPPDGNDIGDELQPSVERPFDDLHWQAQCVNSAINPQTRRPFNGTVEFYKETLCQSTALFYCVQAARRVPGVPTTGWRVTSIVQIP
jgi:hypothetical protein